MFALLSVARHSLFCLFVSNRTFVVWHGVSSYRAVLCYIYVGSRPVYEARSTDPSPHLYQIFAKPRTRHELTDRMRRNVTVWDTILHSIVKSMIVESPLWLQWKPGGRDSVHDNYSVLIVHLRTVFDTSETIKYCSNFCVLCVSEYCWLSWLIWKYRVFSSKVKY